MAKQTRIEKMKQPNILFLLSDEHGFRYMSHVSKKRGRAR